jgi:hypothetical protein
MSEYQYYEFQTIDRPLTNEEMSKLRSYSTRARITPTSFVNDYSWGSFKGDEDSWMERYFDAFLYLANWGTHILKLRLPVRLLDSATARAYCGGDAASVRVKDGKIILSFISQDEEGGEWDEDESQLSSMISIRSELARGDLRALYLGWLLRAQEGVLDDEEFEPPVPPGLGQLSASLESLAGFLRIDGDLLHVAAEASRPLGESGLNRSEIREWVGSIPAGEKDELVTDLLLGADQSGISVLLQRFIKEQKVQSADPTTTGRTVGRLFSLAEACAAERKRLEAEQRAREKARREREAGMAREKHLDSLRGKESKLWGKVESLIATKQPLNYDRAVEILSDLKDLDARGTGSDFRLRLEQICQDHARKTSFIKLLIKRRL